jgi:hypothetical protein
MNELRDDDIDKLDCVTRIRSYCLISYDSSRSDTEAAHEGNTDVLGNGIINMLLRVCDTSERFTQQRLEGHD